VVGAIVFGRNAVNGLSADGPKNAASDDARYERDHKPCNPVRVSHGRVMVLVSVERWNESLSCDGDGRCHWAWVTVVRRMMMVLVVRR
jgi:hypothetical protein